MVPDHSNTQWHDWKWQMANSCRDLADLEKWLGSEFSVTDLNWDQMEEVVTRYRMGISPYYFDLIRVFDQTDPIFRQIVPSRAELTVTPDELEDPIGDEAPARGSRPLKALVHRYQNRVLLMPTALCAVYCRFCFRKRLVGEPVHSAREEDLQAAYDYIREHPEIQEVILTGGDPLTLGDRQLKTILEHLDRIPHLRSIRIHTRLPVVNPYRLTEDLGLIISQSQKPIWVSTHFNHSQEITADAKQAILGWIRMGIPFLNQSVLLKGVNDSVSVLKELLLSLIEARIKPYYLHQADLVKGTSHLRVPIEDGLALLKQLQGEIPGHAMPHYVWDQPGGKGKIPLQNQYDLNFPGLSASAH